MSTLKAAQSLRRRILRVLDASGCVALREVDCRVDGDTVRLTGCVPSFYVKQVAQTVILKLKEVRAVENDLHVSSASRRQ